MDFETLIRGIKRAIQNPTADSTAKELEKATNALRKELDERQQIENALRESETWLLESQRVARVGSYSYDFKSGLWTSSKIMDEVFGIDQDYPRTLEGWLNLIHPDEREAMLQYLTEMNARLAPFNKDFRIIRPSDQAVRWVHGIGEINPDSDGSPAKLFGAIQDISDQKATEDQIRGALKEKEILLKEIHHRVKNNLQIVSSLLSLRSGMLTEPQAVQAFQDCQNEVRAISLIHETLYQSSSLEQIEASEYIPTLVNALVMAFGKTGSLLLLDVNVAPIQLDLDSAIPCGLIVTELFTNAIKHAFPPEWQPADTGRQIRVSLMQVGASLHLDISDNGIGLPEDLDLNKPRSLGLQLVRLLTQQLQGQLEYHNNNGAAFSITFPAP